METDHVVLDPEYSDRYVLVGSDVPDNVRPELQKRRKFAPERNTIINEDVDKLLDVGMIREVMYPEWLANVVVVQKKNGKWRVCIDYTDLNRAYPKDPFPLPHIDGMSVKDIQRLTGRVAALKRFISRSSERCRSFYDLLRKNKSFKWMPEHETAFQELKTYLATPPLLAKPNKGEPLTVYLSVIETADQPAYQICPQKTRTFRQNGKMGDLIAQAISCEFKAINNEAEYEALIARLKGILPKDRHEARALRIKASIYTIINNIFFKVSQAGPYLRCLEPHEVKQVIEDIHDGCCGNHKGGRSLASKVLRTGYFWPTLRADCLAYSSKCEACQLHSPFIHQPSELLHFISAPWLFMKWGMDIVGKLPQAPGQKVYIYDISSEIVCDNDTQFVGKRTMAFCVQWNINLVTSTPGYPKANG
ncbi:uncharacterized protein LOC141588284 [Silene latifolia]|uniref:uncharacterized protein LOC141588284 n=1 Tax=Silene latifolia TaxID=37657 RepID=UPI003D775250